MPSINRTGINSLASLFGGSTTATTTQTDWVLREVTNANTQGATVGQESMQSGAEAALEALRQRRERERAERLERIRQQLLVVEERGEELVSDTPERRIRPQSISVNELMPREGEEMATVGHYVRKNPDLASVVEHPLVVGVGRVGIEVELERTRQLRLRNWNSITDHSLRNEGQEYVLRQPLAGSDLYGAVLELDSALHQVQPEANWRCSTHIHLDVRDMPVDKFKKLILAYTCLERIIFQCSGMHRWGNNFCPSFGFAEAQIIRLSQIWHREDGQFIGALDTSGHNGDRDKYSALNFLPIRRQGSIEFRGSEAKFRKGQLLRLANRILSLKKFAMEFEGTEAELIDYIANSHPSKVLLKSIPAKFAFNQDDLLAGCGLAQDIIYMGKIRSGGRAPVIRTKSDSYWSEYLEMRRPRELRADELYSLISARGLWPGDFIHANSWDQYMAYVEENGLSL